MTKNIPKGTTKLLEQIAGTGGIKNQRLRFLLYTMTILILAALPISLFTIPENLKLVAFVLCVLIVFSLAFIIIVIDKRKSTTQGPKKRTSPQYDSKEDAENFSSVVKVLRTKSASIARTGPNGRVEVTDSEDIDVQDTGYK